jgi:hypothetical protein
MMIITHDSAGEIQPGQTCTMVAQPQIRPLRIHTFQRTDVDNGRFDIVELMIGNRSQFIGGLLHRVSASPRIMNAFELARRFCFETIQAAMDFRLDVQNMGDSPARFSCLWECDETFYALRTCNETLDTTIGPPCAHGYIWQCPHAARQPHIQIAAPKPPQITHEQMERLCADAMDATVREMKERADHADQRLRRLRAEDGPSAVAFAPGRSDRPERVTRAPGFGWDPYGED